MSRVAAVVLAAGASLRMGEVNKLTADLGGRPLIARTIEALAAGGTQPIVVISGHNGEELAVAVAGLDVELIANSHHDRGMGTSIACGVAALEGRADAVMIALGDMPVIAPATIAALLDAHSAAPEAAIAPAHNGKRGHPVLFPAAVFPQLTALDGDGGARAIFAGYPLSSTIEVDDPGIVRDVDTPEHLAEVRGRYSE